MSFSFVWISLERNTYTMPHFLNLSFNLSWSNERACDSERFVLLWSENKLQEKNPHTKGISKKSVTRFGTFNNTRKWSNLSKEKSQNNLFGGIKGMTFKVSIIHGNNRFSERFRKVSPKLFWFLDYAIIIIKISII